MVVTAEPVAVPVELEGLLRAKASWDGRDDDWRLMVEASLLPKIIRKRMSVSTMQAIASCPSRWAVESLLPQPADPFGAAELGTATHQVFEDLFGLPAAQRSLERSVHSPTSQSPSPPPIISASPVGGRPNS